MALSKKARTTGVLVALTALLVGCASLLGIEELPADDGSTGGASGTSGTSGTGGRSGSAGTGAAGASGGVGTLGEACSPEGAEACAGHAESAQLYCFEGKWVPNGVCASGESCDTSSGNEGHCEPIAAECMGKQPDDFVCVGQSRSQCGVDLITITEVETCGEETTCSNGACEPCGGSTRDCDADASNGCETDLSSVATCGTTCANEIDCMTATCTNGICAPSGCPTDCGPSANESCCESVLVPGGSFYRGHDGVTYIDQTNPATLSDFRLDKYEVTVGRFRGFKAEWDGGWRPAEGAGKHTHLNGGAGLTLVEGGNETGWSTSWNVDVAPEDGNLQCSASFPSFASPTWTSTPGANETRPQNCINWFEAYAFCIWDGGFLPSDAERHYAASGGDEQRVYPWSVPPTSESLDCTRANYDCDSSSCPVSIGGDGTIGCAVTDLAFVGTTPAGNGRWDHSDLAGSVSEWNLDRSSSSTYPNPCDDCTQTAGLVQLIRGGSSLRSSDLRVVQRTSSVATSRGDWIGARCARAP